MSTVEKPIHTIYHIFLLPYIYACIGVIKHGKHPQALWSNKTAPIYIYIRIYIIYIGNLPSFTLSIPYQGVNVAPYF